MSKGFDDEGRGFQPGGPAGDAADRKTATKKSVNLSVDADLLTLARAMKINLSQALEEKLCALTEAERLKRARDEFRASAQSYNAYIERNGVFGEEWLDLDEPSV